MRVCNSLPDRDLEESSQYHAVIGRPASTSSDLPMTNKDWRTKAKKMHCGVVFYKKCQVVAAFSKVKGCTTYLVWLECLLTQCIKKVYSSKY